MLELILSIQASFLCSVADVEKKGIRIAVSSYDTVLRILLPR